MALLGRVEPRRRVAGLSAALGHWWALGQAQEFDDFAAALETHAIACQNITYADADGRIGYFYGGVLPRRTRGDNDFWNTMKLPGKERQSSVQQHRQLTPLGSTA